MALNLIHETYRKIDKHASHIHLIGEEALLKLLKTANLPVPATQQKLYAYTLAGNILSDALYYSKIGFGKKKGLVRSRQVACRFGSQDRYCFYAIKIGSEPIAQ